ncbi:phosphate transport system substrate-binding protein [Hydrogenispora ethanolica]|jgi:phosphate transport system substrate-binding protein|uniref:Phosphate-binding protein n=1 Tax=Hydrogenispora ethanolica TaxID=1082276 RepID=A0A4R1RLE6_HYDET|nr:phosphate ABC transporter substrate-binding protein [Hydrogenispora ethanolica]TCL66582.1 phosphate transport system substrate-binding protein [Hydrogenispora ethanolica]
MKKLALLAVIGALLLMTVSSFAALSGTINMVGSTSVQPLAEELAQAFMAKNKGVKIFVQGGGSGAGIKAAMTNSAEIGNSSRELNPDETGIHETVIAKDGIAIVVHKSNPVSNMSTDQLKKIYAGEYTNWKQVGGPDENIVVVNREAGSGTRGAFEEIVLGKTPNTSKCLVQASTGAVQQSVSITKEAIGYISLGSLDTKAVKALKIDGVEATEKNVLAKTYKIQRPFLMLTKNAPAGLVKTFLDWVLSPEGQKIVAKEYISVKQK